jgi:hypothetical protein
MLLLLLLYCSISKQHGRCMSNSSAKRQTHTVLKQAAPAKLDQRGQQAVNLMLYVGARPCCNRQNE